MDWWEYLDGYCERVAPGFWGEPFNAVTNASFLIAALVMWRRTRGIPLARAMCVVLAVIGTGSFLFHTFATAWAELADVLPILGFILLYVYASSRDYLGLRPVWAGASVLAFFPYSALTVPLFSMIPGLGSSAGYGPVPVLILFYAWLVRHRLPEVSRGLTLGAGILLVSLGFRTLDGPICGVLPIGTHFVWHILNGIMLGWMIEVYVRHRLAGRAAGR